jgi:hypothetical protein
VLLNTTAISPDLTRATLYPNPAAGQLVTLTATSLPTAARTVEATLLTTLGRPVRRLMVPVTLSAAQTTVPTTGLATGVYFVRLRTLNAQGAVLGTLPGQRLNVE